MPLDNYVVFYSYTRLQAIRSCVQELYCQLSYRPTCTHFEDQGWSRCSLSDVVAQLKSLQPAVRCMFSQIEAFMKVLLTMPCSNTDAERSFSYFRRMKTYFRNSMNQKRLDHVAVLHVHQELIGCLCR